MSGKASIRAFSFSFRRSFSSLSDETSHSSSYSIISFIRTSYYHYNTCVKSRTVES